MQRFRPLIVPQCSIGSLLAPAVLIRVFYGSPSLLLVSLTLCFFFFQAEDGIRDLTVTGVQTCALPISWSRSAWPAWAWKPPPCRPPNSSACSRTTGKRPGASSRRPTCASNSHPGQQSPRPSQQLGTQRHLAVGHAQRHLAFSLWNPVTRHSERMGPICLLGKFSTATTWRPISSSGRYSAVIWALDLRRPSAGPKSTCST